MACSERKKSVDGCTGPSVLGEAVSASTLRALFVLLKGFDGIKALNGERNVGD